MALRVGGGRGPFAQAVQGGSTPTPPISCAYALNASEAEIQSAGYNARLALSESDQKGSYSLQGGLASQYSSLAAPANATLGTSAKLDFTAGKKAVQFVITSQNLADDASPDTRVSAVASVLAVNFAPLVECFVYTTGEATRLFEIKVGGAYAYSATGAGTTETFTVEIDADAGAVAIRRNGTLLTLAADSFTPQECLVVENITEFAGVNAADAGKIFAIQAITAASSITGTVSSGFTDPCGNAIGA